MADASPSAPAQAQIGVVSNQPFHLTYSSSDAMRGQYVREFVRAGFLLDLSSCELHVLLAMAAWIRADKVTENGNPYVWPSSRDLVNATGLGMSQCAEGKKRLLQRGILSRYAEGGGHDPSSFELRPPLDIPLRNSGGLPSGKARACPPENRRAALRTSARLPSGIPEGTTGIKKELLSSSSSIQLGEAAAAALEREGFDLANAEDAEVFKAATDALVDIAIDNADTHEKRGTLKSSRKRYIRFAILDKYEPLRGKRKPRFAAPAAPTAPAPTMTPEERRAIEQRRKAQRDAAEAEAAKVAAAIKARLRPGAVPS